MYFNFACPSCSKSVRVNEGHSGRVARCPYCKTQLTIPEIGGAESTASSPPGRGVGGSESAATETSGSPQVPVIVTGPSTVVRSQRGTAKSTARRPGRKQDAQDDGTNVGILWTALIGLGVTVVYYVVVGLLPKMYFRDLFYDRGMVTVVETYFMFWSIAILVLKSRKLMRQRESMLFDLLPETLGKDITPERVEPFLKQIGDLPVSTASFLVRRVQRGLEHFGVRGSASEVSTVLASQSELDNAAVASSYSLLNVFIWAIPILGFIGTVQGLGDAVGNLSGSLESAADVESIKKSLGAITGGLGVAFDTTLVALIMSLFLKFPASSLQKSEEDLLNWVEDYCNETLLKRLKDVGSNSPPANSDAAIQLAINAALAPHHAELRGWSSRLKEIGKSLTDDIAQGWTVMQADASVRRAEQLAQLTETMSVVDAVTRRHAEAVEHWNSLLPRQAEHYVAAAAALETVAQGAVGAQQQVADAVRQSAASLEEHFAILRQAVSNMNDVLGALNGKQVEIQVQSPPRRGWFRR